jgi:phosphate-selective porin OprO and OprP
MWIRTIARRLPAACFLHPFRTTSLSALKGLGFGVGGSYQVDQQTNVASLTPGFNTDGQQRFFSYNTNGTAGFGLHWRISPQGYYYHGPVHVMGEYVISDQKVINTRNDRAELQNTAWEINAGWVLTGEDITYSGVNPRHSFAPLKNQWGALQCVGRYAELHVDDATFPAFANPGTAASAAKAWAVGLNWYLNRNIRVNASYSHTRFEGGNGVGATVTQQPEKVFFTRMQLSF